MYIYLVAFVLLSPLLGIVLVENGEYAPTLGVDGFPNGAAWAYGLYVLVVVIVALVIAGRERRMPQPLFPVPGSDGKFRRFGVTLIVFELIFLAVFLFGFGAINVWNGSVGKGAFRTELGPLGAIPNLMTKFIVPALLAYAGVLYQRSSRRRGAQWLLGANMTVAFVIGASWGFKSTAFVILTPTLLLLLWRMSVSTLLRLGLLFIGGMFAFFNLFDSNTQAYADATTFLFRRITVIQGDMAWYIWGQYADGAVFPNYWPTLIAAAGDSTLQLFGYSRESFMSWMSVHYDFMLTYLSGAPIYQIQEGHSVTATPFAEGLIAGGIPGVALFAVIGGVLVGGTYRLLAWARRTGRDQWAAVLATYFCFYVFGWLNSGAIVQLIHISQLFGLSATIIALEIMRRLQGGGANSQ